MTSRRAFYSLVLSVTLCWPIRGGAAISDPDFTETSWITVGCCVTGMAWAPDGSGRLFIAQKEGTIRIVKMGSPPTLMPTPFATVSPIFTESECGLIGIAFDPDFVSNGYVYVFATVSSTEQQIVRYTAVGDVGANKTIVIAGLPTKGINHDGGAVGFGPDGRLYWAIGDQGDGTGVDADLASLASKVGRANIEGTAPADNPFVDGPGGDNDFIWARGLRNPFTFTFQPATGDLWIDVAGAEYEQVFVVHAGDHAGWDDFENNQPVGFIPPAIKYRTNGVDVRTIAAVGAMRSGTVATYTTTTVHGFRQGEKVSIAGVTDPSFNGSFFVASVPTGSTLTVSQPGPDATSGDGTATTLHQGGAITGGAFYDATAFPASYRGNFFYGDFNSGRIMRATVGPGTTVTSVDYWAANSGNAIDVAPGPDGDLYYVDYGGTVFRARHNATAQLLIVSNAHVPVSEGRTAVVSVRLAIAPTSDVTVDVARTAGSSDVAVAAGAILTFTPANWGQLQTVVLSAADDDDLLADTATITVASTGLTSETVAVNVIDTSGAFGGNSPGRVPDGDAVPGAPLQIGKNTLVAGNLDMTWAASCAPGGTDYSVQEGALGVWYSHGALLCTTGGATSATIMPGAGDRYYLVVPMSAEREGSYGTDSAGAEHPRSGHRCRTERDTTPCP